MPDSTPAAPFPLENPVPARRGSVSERFVKCGKSACPCAHDPKARHGPYFSFNHAVKGRTQSRFLSAEAVLVVRGQIERGQPFRNVVSTPTPPTTPVYSDPAPADKPHATSTGARKHLPACLEI